MTPSPHTAQVKEFQPIPTARESYNFNAMCKMGNAPLSLIRDLPLLPIELAITEIAATYVQQKVMPADPTGDALHLAIASFHKCDFLVTWNCAHIANANKFGHIRRVNTMLGLFVPALVTPLELLGVDHESNDI